MMRRRDEERDGCGGGNARRHEPTIERIRGVSRAVRRLVAPPRRRRAATTTSDQRMSAAGAPQLKFEERKRAATARQLVVALSVDHVAD